MYNGFSILIPTWNNLDYLKLCVRSIRQHSAYNHQIIIHVNDGSDGTLEWVKAEGLEYTHSDENIGVCLAMNSMRRHVKTDYIYFINDDMFSVMKDGVVFVNMSRAAVVDEDAAWIALQNGKLGAFGSDVWWNAPKRGESQSYPSAKHEFWKLDNVLMSPHRAGFVEDALPHLDGAIRNLIALVNGEPLTGLVDKRKKF